MSRYFADPRNQAIVEQNQKDLGYAARLKFVIDGRLEIIGVHIDFVDGRPRHAKAWCPAVKKCIGKLGGKVGVDCSTGAVVARFLSLSTICAGTIDPLCEAFLNSALRHINRLEEAQPDAGMGFDEFMDQTIRVKEWDHLHKVGLELGVHTMRDIYDNACSKYTNACAPSTTDQIKMLNISLFERADHPDRLDGDDFAKLQHFASLLESEMGDEEMFSLLPKQLWK